MLVLSGEGGTYENSKADGNAAAELARTNVDHVEKYGRLDEVEGEKFESKKGVGRSHDGGLHLSKPPLYTAALVDVMEMMQATVTRAMGCLRMQCHQTDHDVLATDDR